MKFINMFKVYKSLQLNLSLTQDTFVSGGVTLVARESQYRDPAIQMEDPNNAGTYINNPNTDRIADPNNLSGPAQARDIEYPRRFSAATDIADLEIEVEGQRLSQYVNTANWTSGKPLSAFRTIRSQTLQWHTTQV